MLKWKCSVCLGIELTTDKVGGVSHKHRAGWWSLYVVDPATMTRRARGGKAGK